MPSIEEIAKINFYYNSNKSLFVRGLNKVIMLVGSATNN